MPLLPLGEDTREHERLTLLRFAADGDMEASYNIKVVQGSVLLP